MSCFKASFRNQANIKITWYMVHSAALLKFDAYFRMPILGCQKHYI